MKKKMLVWLILGCVLFVIVNVAVVLFVPLDGIHPESTTRSITDPSNPSNPSNPSEHSTDTRTTNDVGYANYADYSEILPDVTLAERSGLDTTVFLQTQNTYRESPLQHTTFLTYLPQSSDTRLSWRYLRFSAWWNFEMGHFNELWCYCDVVRVNHPKVVPLILRSITINNQEITADSDKFSYLNTRVGGIRVTQWLVNVKEGETHATEGMGLRGGDITVGILDPQIFQKGDTLRVELSWVDPVTRYKYMKAQGPRFTDPGPFSSGSPQKCLLYDPLVKQEVEPRIFLRYVSGGSDTRIQLLLSDTKNPRVEHRFDGWNAQTGYSPPRLHNRDTFANDWVYPENK